jgi:phage terminase large subunit
MEDRKEIDPEGYKIYGLGEWGETGGLILSNWVCNDISTDWRDYDDCVLAQDFGYNHANCILLIGFKDNNIYVLDEIYEHEKTAIDIRRLADDKFPKHLIMWCDSANPDKILEWCTAGWIAYAVVKGAGSVKAQIDYLKQHKIIIHPNCVNTIKEIQQWKWKFEPKLNMYLDDPVPFFDDAMACLRYGVENLMRYGGQL